jgi:hypothetical protein
MEVASPAHQGLAKTRQVAFFQQAVWGANMQLWVKHKPQVGCCVSNADTRTNPREAMSLHTSSMSLSSDATRSVQQEVGLATVTTL